MHRAALIRAGKLIDKMADYIGSMVLTADDFAALNEHWLYMEKLERETVTRENYQDGTRDGV